MGTMGTVPILRKSRPSGWPCHQCKFHASKGVLKCQCIREIMTNPLKHDKVQLFAGKFHSCLSIPD